jgi:hypothetical protein
MILGDYAPKSVLGLPLVALRDAGRAEDVSLPKDRTPIFYLPGVSRLDLRAVESCRSPEALAELQYRGVIWSQINAERLDDPAYLNPIRGGLGCMSPKTTMQETPCSSRLFASRRGCLLAQKASVWTRILQHSVDGWRPIRDLAVARSGGRIPRRAWRRTNGRPLSRSQVPIGFNPRTKAFWPGALTRKPEGSVACRLERTARHLCAPPTFRHKSEKSSPSDTILAHGRTVLSTAGLSGMTTGEEPSRDLLALCQSARARSEA